MDLIIFATFMVSFMILVAWVFYKNYKDNKHQY